MFTSKIGDKITKYIIGGSILAGTLNTCIKTVMPGERGVIFRQFGIGEKGQGVNLKRTLKPGAHFLFPWEQLVLMDSKLQPMTIQDDMQTKDLQEVKIRVRILCKAKEDGFPYVYQKYNTDYRRIVSNSLGAESLKSVVARYNCDQLLMKREQISREITQILKEGAEGDEFRMEIADISITHLGFTPRFKRAIEDKQIAQQRAQQAKFEVEEAQQRKKARVILAEGTAKAARIFNEAINKHGNIYLLLKQLETSKTIAKSLAKSKNITFIPEGNNLLLSVDLDGKI